MAEAPTTTLTSPNQTVEKAVSDIIARSQATGPTGGGAQAPSIAPQADKLVKGLAAELKKLEEVKISFGVFANKMLAHTKEFAKQAGKFGEAALSLNGAALLGAVSGMLGAGLSMVATITKALLSIAASVAGLPVKAITEFNKVIASGFGGAAGFLNGLIQGFTNLMKNIPIAGAVLGPVGDAIGGMMSNLVQAGLLAFHDALAHTQAIVAERAQSGEKGEIGGGISQQMMKLRGYLGRDETLEWSKNITAVGVTHEDIAEKTVRIGKAMGTSASETAGLLDQYLMVSNGATDAIQKMGNVFKQMQNAAYATNIPVKMLYKAVIDTAAAGRFLNVDLKTVSNTIALMAKDADKMKGFGVNFRNAADMKAAAADLTGASGKLTDEMHAYFGMKAAPGSTVGQAWALSTLGSTYGKNLKYDATKGTMTMGAGVKGKELENTMTLQRMAVMQQTLQEVMAKTAGGEGEKLLAAKMAGQQLFGIGMGAITTLITHTKDDLKGLMEDPDTKEQMQDEKDLLHRLTSLAAIDQTVQRYMAQMAVQQVVLALQAVKLLALGVDVLMHPHIFDQENNVEAQRFEKQLTAMGTTFNLIKDAGYNALKVSGTFATNPSVMKAWNALGDMDTGKGKLVATVKNPDGSVTEIHQKAMGGPFTSGTDMLVGERGPERVRFNVGGTVIPNHDLMRGALASGGGGGTTNVFNLHIADSTPHEIIANISRAIETTMSS